MVKDLGNGLRLTYSDDMGFMLHFKPEKSPGGAGISIAGFPHTKAKWAAEQLGIDLCVDCTSSPAECLGLDDCDLSCSAFNC